MTVTDVTTEVTVAPGLETDASPAGGETPFTVSGLNDAEQTALNQLWTQYTQKLERNRIRAARYDGRNAVRDLGISTPPSMRNLAIVLGWPAKAVDILARRCLLDGFTVPGQADITDLGVDQIVEDNRLDTELPQANVSSLIHATAFLIATQGDTASGEPKVLVTAKDAMSGTGIWNPRTRSLDSFLSIVQWADPDGDITAPKPTCMVLYLPNLNVTITRSSGAWLIERRRHSYGMPVEPLVYRARLGRPFGSSRISRAVMSLHDTALRTMLRSEVASEFYAMPQRVLLGAGEKAFQDAQGNPVSKWQSVMGRIWAIPDDEDATNPRASVEQLAASSQEPYQSQMRQLAQQFAGETSIPVTSLGIANDANPTSAEAYYASREDLIMEAEGTTAAWSPAYRRTMVRALAMMHGWSLDSIPPEAKKLRPKWRNPATPSRSAAADAAQKAISQFPWLAQSGLGMELYGLDQDFIDRAMAEKSLADARQTVAALTQAPPPAPTPNAQVDQGAVSPNPA